jgi:phosphoribosylanthranilate isomerase
MNIKICGVKTVEVADAVIEAGATHIGFIFFERSPRNLTPGKAVEIAKHIKGKIKTVIVTVDPTDKLLTEITSLFKPDFIQLHGSENAERLKVIKRKYGMKLIKAISVKEKADLKKADEFRHVADYILFDAKPGDDSELPGGNAISFDWEILHDFKPGYKYILSGGLTPENVQKAINTTGASFLDVSSGVESTPGNKDISMIKRFISEATQP